MVWDIGTYEVVEGNYWKGNLEISLKGKKLKGQWSLRRDRMKGQTGWVLEKTGLPIKPISAKKDDESALSGRTMAQIAQAQDATWHSNRGAVRAAREPAVEVPGAIIDKSELEKLPRVEAAF